MLSASLLQLIHRLTTHPTLYAQIQADDRTAVARCGITLSDPEWEVLRAVLSELPWPGSSGPAQSGPEEPLPYWGGGPSLAPAALARSTGEDVAGTTARQR